MMSIYDQRYHIAFCKRAKEVLRRPSIWLVVVSANGGILSTHFPVWIVLRICIVLTRRVFLNLKSLRMFSSTYEGWLPAWLGWRGTTDVKGFSKRPASSKDQTCKLGRQFESGSLCFEDGLPRQNVRPLVRFRECLCNLRTNSCSQRGFRPRKKERRELEWRGRFCLL